MKYQFDIVGQGKSLDKCRKWLAGTVCLACWGYVLFSSNTGALGDTGDIQERLFDWFSPLLPAAVLSFWLHGVSVPAENIFYCCLGICDSSAFGRTGKIANFGRIILQNSCSSVFSNQKTLCPLPGQW